MDDSHVPLADALFALARRPDGKRVVQRKFSKVGPGGAVLTDLVAQRRASSVDGKVVPDDTGAVPSGLSGEYDAMVRSEARPRSAKYRGRKFRGSDVGGRVADHVQESGLAAAEEDAVRKVIEQADAAVRNAAIPTVNANNGSQGF